MNTPTSSFDAVLSAILQPHSNYSARSAARQEAVQLQGYLTAQEQQKALEEQQAQAAIDQQLEAERSLPFMGRDVQNIAAEVRKQEKQVFERIRDNYKGDARAFFNAEGNAFMANATRQLTQSPAYQQATLNRKNVMQAEQARQSGERLIGGFNGDNYESGETRLGRFLSGQSDAYEHKGSYKPDDDLKELRSQYAVGKPEWEQTAVSEEDKLAHLINKFGQDGGYDRYIRHHKNVPTYYKTAPLTDAIKFGQDQQRFQMEKGRYGMAQEDQAMQRQLQGLQVQGLKLSNQKKANELSGGSGPGGAMPYDHYLLSSPSEIIPLKHDPASPKRLSNGVDLGKINKLAGVTLYGQGDDILARHLGLQRTRDGYRGHFDSAFSTENGVNAVNLKGVNYEILGVDSKAFYNPADMGPNADPHGHLQGFARVTLRLSPYAADVLIP